MGVYSTTIEALYELNIFNNDVCIYIYILVGGFNHLKKYEFVNGFRMTSHICVGCGTTWSNGMAHWLFKEVPQMVGQSCHFCLTLIPMVIQHTKSGEIAHEIR